MRRTADTGPVVAQSRAQRLAEKTRPQEESAIRVLRHQRDVRGNVACDDACRLPSRQIEQRAKGGKPETRVDEKPKQKPRRTNEGRCLLEKRRTSRAFGGQKKKKKKELKEEAQERGKARGDQTRPDQGVIRMGVSSGQVSRKRGNQGDAWMGMVCPRVLPVKVLRRGSQIDGIGTQARMEKRDTPREGPGPLKWMHLTLYPGPREAAGRWREREKREVVVG